MTRRELLLQEIAILEELQRRKPAWQPMKHDPTRPNVLLPQYLAFTSTASIVGYGGSAGGGKTDWAIGMALTQGIRSIIYRKHYSDFEKIDERFGQLVGSKCIKHGSPYMVMPPTGTRGVKAERIVLASLDHEKSKEKYQGRDYDKVIFDEVTQIERSIVEYLMGWCRSVNDSVIPQVLMTFNPPTRPEGAWVKDFFAPWLNKAHPLYGKVASGEILHRASIPSTDGKTSAYHYFTESQTVTHNPVTGAELARPIPTHTITFIRASLRDNLHLRDTDYESRILGNSDPNVARIFLDGDFETDFQDGIYSIFKPQHFERSIERYKALEWTPNRPPDVIAIDAAMGGEDEMVVRLGYKEVTQGEPTRYIYPPALKIRGSSVPNDVAQWEWLSGAIPDLLHARLFIIDVVGGAGTTIASIIAKEVHARHGKSDHVISFKGGANSNWRDISDWDSGSAGIGAMGYANDISCAWQTAGRAQQHTETCIAPDDELQRQCLSRNFKSIESHYAIEPKESFSQRLGRSPDDADAYVMAAYGLHRMLGAFGK